MLIHGTRSIQNFFNTKARSYIKQAFTFHKNWQSLLISLEHVLTLFVTGTIHIFHIFKLLKQNNKMKLI